MAACDYCRQLGCETCPKCIHHHIGNCIGCKKMIVTESPSVIDRYVCQECFKKNIDVGEVNYSFKGMK